MQHPGRCWIVREMRRTAGSHAVLRHPDGCVAIVPQHGTVKRGALSSILRQAGLTPAEFLDLLR